MSNIKHKRITLAWPLIEPIMGGSRDGCNATKHCAIEFTKKYDDVFK
jgi:hypothetical protein